jgi:flagellar M-ring protein FliF
MVAIWSKMQPTQRATIVLSSLFVFAGLGTLVFFMNRVEYVVLYRDLNPEDAQAIAAKLKELKKDYQVSADQSMIEVADNSANVDKLRLDIAGAGLARSGRVGYEIFDKNQFGMTDFTEQVNYKRALEGELGRTISSLSEVSEGRVHLVLPKDSLFEDQKEEAKASVFVRLKKGKELSKSSIAGIVNLVAGAVQGLPTYNISVVDGEGRVLSKLPSGDSARSDFESGVKADIEKEMVAKVASILEPVVGKGKVHANASVEVEVNSSEQTEETYQPTPPPAVLSQSKTEERVGSAGLASGVPGTRSSEQGSVNSPERSRQSEMTNYEVSKLVRHTIQPKGSVQRLSIAVLLDYKPAYSKDKEGKTTASFQPHSQKELDSYRGLVLAAIGYNEERGDTVTLENMPFFSEPAIEEDQTPLPWHLQWQNYLLPAMKYTAFLVLFLLAYVLLFRPVRKRILQSIGPAQAALPAGAAPAGRIGTGTPAAKAAIAAGSSAATTAGAPLALPQGAGSASLAEIEAELTRESEMVGNRKYEVLKKRIIDHAVAEPEQASQLVRAWIHEKP